METEENLFFRLSFKTPSKFPINEINYEKKNGGKWKNGEMRKIEKIGESEISTVDPYLFHFKVFLWIDIFILVF